MKLFKRFAALSLSAATALGTIAGTLPVQVMAEESSETGSSMGIVSATAEGNVVNLEFASGVKGRITFLEDGIFRYNVDPSGEFSKYASPKYSGNTARIQAQPDEDDSYSHPDAAAADDGESVTITSGTTKILFDKATGKMTVYAGDKKVMEEASPLQVSSSGTVQNLVINEGENFYGGGTQNGRINHTGSVINIANESNWVDGGVSSPSPFYWSTNGYGVLRNTFADGSYNFGSGSDTVKTTHSENEFDAYYFVTAAEDKTEITQDLLQEYFAVTGNPVLLPEYGFYLGHLNCYNRDGWSDTSSASSGGKTWTIKDDNPSTSEGTSTVEYGMASGYVIPSTLSAESLNGTPPTVNSENFVAKDTPYKYSARAVIDRYAANDIPFGWFLPNDGYGCGYGQNGYYKDGGTDEEREASLLANVNNLKEFTEYANAHGVNTGLWTQSNLTPIASEKQHLVRDFEKEVTIGGITTLKTDVAWVGYGYSMALSATKQAYDIVTTEVSARPNIISLDGWAGTQRFASIWTGDQYGGQWEYIRFHIPTYIGQSLAGNPNIGSDMDGIFGGEPIITTRDFQWKTFTPQMLDMDGWGTYAKTAYTHGDPYTGIARMYLKLKAQLMPYIYTTAASAANIDTGNGDEGLPMIRAMMLADDSDYAASDSTMYQYMFGDSFLVAPIYQETDADDEGNDIRDNIYLPGDSSDIWIDYFSGDQYYGGQVVNNFDAPLWKLPLFVRNGAIIPMYTENNNPEAVTEYNPDGLDKTQRIVEFYPYGETSYTLYEDDGTTAINNTTEDDEYGTIDHVSYGGSVSTVFTSVVDEDAATATLTAKASTGTYTGYDSNRSTQFTVNVSQKPSDVLINGAAGNEVSSLEAFEALGEDESGWFYDAKPNLNKYAGEGTSFAEVEITTTPKVYVKFAKADVAKEDQVAVIQGFANEGDLPADTLNENLGMPEVTVNEDLLTPTSTSISWNAIDGASLYQIECNGILYSTAATTFTHSDLDYDTAYTYKVRAVNAEGYSAWSEPVTATTLLDPWRNTPVPVKITWTGGLYGSHSADLAFDHIFQSTDGGFHSSGGAIGQQLILDYGLVYQFDNLEYYPRDDAGNGTVTSMDISYSLDGKHWTEVGTQTWERSADMKEVALNCQARYIRMIPRESVGSFFSASEICVNKVDGSKAYALGSNLLREEVSEGDLTNLLNYKGIENKEPYASDFDSQIKKHYADMNNNGVYDVFDYSFTLSALDGGTTKTGEPTGALFYLADKSEVKAGDIVTVSVYASEVTNANALGGIFRFNNASFDAVVPEQTNGIIGTSYVKNMENLSIIRSFGDGTSTVNIAFANRGDKALVNVTDTIATFQLKAKVSGTLSDLLSLDQETMIIGPEFDDICGTSSRDINIPDVPSVTKTKLAQSDLTCYITNETYPDLDDSNLAAMIQQASWDGLFDGNNDSSDRNFELLWTTNGNFDADKLKTPITLTFVLNNPAPVDSFDLYTGALTSNGSVQKLSAKVTFSDGTTEEFSGGDYDTPSTHFNFAVSEDNAQKTASKVEITILETKGANENTPDNSCLTLAEMEIYTATGVPVSSIEENNNAKILNIGDISKVEATVLPESTANRYFTVSSSNPEVAAVEGLQSGNVIIWFVKGLSEGTATITLTAAGDTSVTTSYDVTVTNVVDTSALEAAIAKARAIGTDRLTDASKEDLAAAIAAAQAVLDDADHTKNDVVTAVMNLQEAIASLKYVAPDEDNLINKTADSGVTAEYTSSECGPDLEEGGAYGSMTLDKDDQTYWHSNWNNGDTMPQYILYNLGAVYNLSDVSYLARQNGYNGDIYKVELYAGLDADNLEYIGTYTFDYSGYQLTDRDSYKVMSFEPVKAQYVKFNVVGSLGDTANDSFCSMSEIKFYQLPGSDTPVDPEVPAANKTLLVQAVAYADAIVEAGGLEGVNDIVKDLFNTRLAAAKDVLANEDATQDEVDQAWLDLSEAIHMLDFRTDKTQLAALIAEAEALDLSQYKEEGQDEFKAALAYAKEVYADDAALNDQSILEAMNRLNAAMNALQPKNELDTSMLEFLVDYVKDVDLSLYIDKDQKEFTDALAEAKAVLANPESQAQIDACARRLNKAWISLRLRPSEELLKKLTDFVDKASKMNRSSYKAETLTLIDEAVSEVQEALNNPDLSAQQAQALADKIDPLNELIDNPDAITPAAPAAEEKVDPAVTDDSVEPAVTDNTVKPAENKAAAAAVDAAKKSASANTAKSVKTGLIVLPFVALAAAAAILLVILKRKSADQN